MAGRKPLIEEENPLMNKPDENQEIPSVNSKNQQEAKKTFSYRLPNRIGMKFKFYCHQHGSTAEQELEKILEDWLSTKKVVL